MSHVPHLSISPDSMAWCSVPAAYNHNPYQPEMLPFCAKFTIAVSRERYRSEQNGRSESEQEKKAGQVCQRGDEDRGGDGGIDAHTLEEDREERTRE